MDWRLKWSGFQFAQQNGSEANRVLSRTDTRFQKKKFRPTGSYAKHKFKALFSTVCRCLAFMSDKVDPDAIAVNSIEKVRNKIESFNLDIGEANRRISCMKGVTGERIESLMKTDVDNFFGPWCCESLIGV